METIRFEMNRLESGWKMSTANSSLAVMTSCLHNIKYTVALENCCRWWRPKYAICGLTRASAHWRARESEVFGGTWQFTMPPPPFTADIMRMCHIYKMQWNLCKFPQFPSENIANSRAFQFFQIDQLISLSSRDFSFLWCFIRRSSQYFKSIISKLN